MANNFDSNITQKLAKVFLEKFETERVLSKNVNTQLLANAFNPSTGDTVNFKRPTDYVSARTAAGDISGGSALNSIVTGKASGVVQDYFTVELQWTEADQAIKMDQLEQLIAPAARRIVTDLEVDYAGFMMKNTALLAGAVGTPVTTWDHVAEAGAVLASSGVPRDMAWKYAVNPYTQRKLAGLNKALGAGGAAGGMIKNANNMAVIDQNFAGMEVRTSTALSSYTTHSAADRVGAITTIDVTYATAKDTMTQDIVVSGFNANLQVRAGETLTVTGRNRVNLSTKQEIVDDAGAAVLFSGTVTTAVTLSGTGTGTITITGPAIFETGVNGGHNTTSSAVAAADVITLGGAASTLIQPNLFWHPQAFGIGSVPISKLYSTDTIATTSDGLQIRCSKGASIRENTQIVRFDFRPSYAVLNPFFAGQSFG